MLIKFSYHIYSVLQFGDIHGIDVVTQDSVAPPLSSTPTHVHSTTMNGWLSAGHKGGEVGAGAAWQSFCRPAGAGNTNGLTEMSWVLNVDTKGEMGGASGTVGGGRYMCCFLLAVLECIGHTVSTM